MAGLSNKRQAFVEEYLLDFNATQAAIRAGYSEHTAHVQGPRLLGNVSVQVAIQQRLSEKVMKADEVLTRLAEQARANIGDLFKTTEDWVEYPLPTQEVLEAKQEEDDDGNLTWLYKVRRVVLDLDKLKDPKYSHLIKKFTDSPRSGLSVEMYDAQAALVHIGRHHKLFTDNLDVKSDDKELIPADKLIAAMRQAADNGQSDTDQ